MNWLLLFVPVAIGLEFLTPDRHLLIFVASSLAVLPLAGSMGRATEELAEHLGEGIGGLLQCDLRQRRRTHHRAHRVACRSARCRKGVHRRLDHGKYSACPWRWNVGWRIASVGTALQCRRRTLA